MNIGVASAHHETPTTPSLAVATPNAGAATRSAGAAEHPESIRVALVEAHPRMRRTLRTLLDGEPGLELITEDADVESVAARSRSLMPDVVVFGVGFQSGASLRAIQALHENLPGAAVVVTTMDDSAIFARRALELGAYACVLKECAVTDLAQAVRSASQRGSFDSALAAGPDGH